MRKLKELALTEIPKEYPLRDVLLTEKEYLMVDEYLAKMEVALPTLVPGCSGDVAGGGAEGHGCRGSPRFVFNKGRTGKWEQMGGE